MKTIFRNSVKLAIAALCLLGSVTTYAQETVTTTSTQSENYDQGWRLGFGLSGGVPLNAEPYEWNLGGDVRLQYDLSTRYSLTFTTGFNNFFVNGDDNDLGYIPVKGGFKAFVLKDQLYLLAEDATKRTSQVSSGDRSAKIRTYNYAQGRVTDHRIGLDVFDMDGVMNGKIQKFVDELQMVNNMEKLKESEVF